MANDVDTDTQAPKQNLVQAVGDTLRSNLVDPAARAQLEEKKNRIKYNVIDDAGPKFQEAYSAFLKNQNDPHAIANLKQAVDTMDKHQAKIDELNKKLSKIPVPQAQENAANINWGKGEEFFPNVGKTLAAVPSHVSAAMFGNPVFVAGQAMLPQLGSTLGVGETAASTAGGAAAAGALPSLAGTAGGSVAAGALRSLAAAAVKGAGLATAAGWAMEAGRRSGKTRIITNAAQESGVDTDNLSELYDFWLNNEEKLQGKIFFNNIVAPLTGGLTTVIGGSAGNRIAAGFEKAGIAAPSAMQRLGATAADTLAWQVPVGAAGSAAQQLAETGKVNPNQLVQETAANVGQMLPMHFASELAATGAKNAKDFVAERLAKQNEARQQIQQRANEIYDARLAPSLKEAEATALKEYNDKAAEQAYVQQQTQRQAAALRGEEAQIATGESQIKQAELEPQVQARRAETEQTINQIIEQEIADKKLAATQDEIERRHLVLRKELEEAGEDIGVGRQEPPYGFTADEYRRALRVGTPQEPTESTQPYASEYLANERYVPTGPGDEAIPTNNINPENLPQGIPLKEFSIPKAPEVIGTTRPVLVGGKEGSTQFSAGELGGSVRQETMPDVESYLAGRQKETIAQHEAGREQAIKDLIEQMTPKEKGKEPGSYNPENWFDKAIEKFHLSTLAIKRLTPEVFDLNNQQRSRFAQEVSEGQKRLINIASSMDEAARQYGVSPEVMRRQADDYAMAMHAPEANALHGRDGMVNGMTTQEANDKVKMYESLPYADVLRAYQKAVVGEGQRVRDVISQLDPESGKRLSQYQNYVPKMVEKDTPQALWEPEVQQTKALAKELKGGVAERKPILESLDSLNKSIAKRQAEKIMYDGMLENGYGKEVEGVPQDANSTKYLSANFDGKKHYLEIDPNVGKALHGLNVEEAGSLLKVTGSLARLYSAVWVGGSPLNVLTSMIPRDLQLALATLNNVGVDSSRISFMQKYPGAAKALSEYHFGSNEKQGLQDFLAGKEYNRRGQVSNSEWAKAIDEYYKEGGKTGAFAMKKGDFLKKIAPHADASNPIVSALGQVMKSVWHFSEVADDLPRVVAYKSVRDNGGSVADAVKAAQNITINFNQGGTQSQAMNALFLFFRATEQSTVNGLKGLFTNRDGKFDATNFGKGMLMMTLAQANLKQAAYTIDPDYDKKYDTNRYFVFPMNRNYAFAIKKEYALQALFAGSDLASDALIGRLNNENVKQKLAEAGKSMIEGYSPIASGPTFAPILQAAYNKDAWGRPIDTPENRAKLGQTMTGRASVGAANTIEDFTGKQVSPATIDYLFRSFGGGNVAFANKISQTMKKVEAGNTVSAADWAALTGAIQKANPKMELFRAHEEQMNSPEARNIQQTERKVNRQREEMARDAYDAVANLKPTMSADEWSQWKQSIGNKQFVKMLNDREDKMVRSSKQLSNEAFALEGVPQSEREEVAARAGVNVVQMAKEGVLQFGKTGGGSANRVLAAQQTGRAPIEFQRMTAARLRQEALREQARRQLLMEQ